MIIVGWNAVTGNGGIGLLDEVDESLLDKMTANRSLRDGEVLYAREFVMQAFVERRLGR
jgi:hypothetical protein